MEKISKKTIVYEAFNNYDGSRDKNHDLLTRLKVNMESFENNEAHQS